MLLWSIYKCTYELFTSVKSLNFCYKFRGKCWIRVSRGGDYVTLKPTLSYFSNCQIFNKRTKIQFKLSSYVSVLTSWWLQLRIWKLYPHSGPPSSCHVVQFHEKSLLLLTVNFQVFNWGVFFQKSSELLQIIKFFRDIPQPLQTKDKASPFYMFTYSIATINFCTVRRYTNYVIEMESLNSRYLY
jgi:hypothetical protein